MKRNCGAVIINYNDDKRVIALVNNLSNQEVLDAIVVVDNNSAEESKNNLRKLLSIKNVHVVFNEKNTGFNEATNIGFKKLTEEGCSYVFAINSDVEVTREVMDGCVQLLENDEKLALVSCQMIEGGKKKQFYYNFPTIKSEINNDLGLTKLLRIKPKIRERHDDYCVVDFIRFSFVCIRASYLKEVDYLDNGTFLYFGEAMLAKKFKKKGYKEAFLSQCEYRHNHIYKSGYKSNGYRFTYEDSLYYFKHYTKANKFQLCLLKVAYKIGFLIRRIVLPDFKNKT